MNVAVVDEALPQPSVAVKVTVALPVTPQRSESELKSLLQVTPEHASEAVAPPLLASQAFKADVLPVPSHSTVDPDAAVTVGGVVSLIVKLAVELTEFPEGSVAVKVTVALPVFPQAPVRAVKLFVQVTPQASVAVAPQ